MPYWIKFLCAAVFLIATEAVALTDSPLQKTFYDWQVTCNNLNDCVARNVGDHQGLVMSIERDAGNDDRPLLRIQYGSRSSGERHSAQLSRNLLIDQQRLQPDLKHWRENGQRLQTTHTVAINEFLAQVIDAREIQLTGIPEAHISLHGLKSALLMIDERQGRVNGMSAWIKRGKRSASDIPPEPRIPLIELPSSSLPDLTHEETRALIDFGTWQINTRGCSLDLNRREIRVAPLNSEKAILIVSCEMGAYNMIDLAFEVSRAAPYIAQRITLTLPFSPPDGNRQLELINSSYDLQRRELRTLSRDRDSGDCGYLSRWRFNGERFLLTEYAKEPVCDGWNQSENWPVLWVTKQQTMAE